MQRIALPSLFAGLARRTWLVTAIAVVSCAAFAAHAATALVDAATVGPTRGTAPRAEVPPPSARPPALPEGGQLVERNMFCSSCALTGASSPAAVPPSSAVLIAIDIGHEARATVHVLATEVQGSWGIGDAIPGLGQVDRIGPMWLEIVDGAGHRARLSLLDAAAGDGPRPTVPERAPAVADPLADRIKKLDDQNYDIDRNLVRELVSAGARPGGPRFMPLVENGEVKGVRLFAVKPGSVPAALGLKNGDTLSAIDGAPLVNLNQLLELYSKLDQLGAVELSGTRAGKPLVRTLRLH